MRSTPPKGSTELLFIVPTRAPARRSAPERTRDDESGVHPVPAEGRRRDQRAVEAAAVEMLPAARDAARRLKISEDDIAAVLNSPDHREPDPTRAGRMRLVGRGLEIAVGGDGVVLRVAHHH